MRTIDRSRTQRIRGSVHARLRSRWAPVLLMLAGSGAAAPATPATAQPAAVATLPHPKHIVILIAENKGYGDIINSTNASYLNALTTQGASLTNFCALHHPSQPNYINFFSGATQGIFNDTCPKAKFTAPSLGGSLIQNKLSFKGYAEDLPHDLTICMAGNTYGRKHCPWLDFTDVPAGASSTFTTFPKQASGFEKLPAVSLVIPNLFHDMHSAKTDTQDPIPEEIATGDAWLKEHLDAYVQWAKANNSLLIVTWDEDSSTYDYPTDASMKIDTQPPHNHIATILVGAMVTPGATSAQQYTHHDLLRTIEDMFGLPLLGGSQNARDIDGIWK